MIPPLTIDGAQVLEFAWSDVPFGVVRNSDGDVVDEIHGLAICRYADSDVIYRFSCDKAWETSQDADYSSIQEAKDSLPMQYHSAPVVWQKYGASQHGDAPDAASD